jgi:signal transduction histidine kinase
MITQATSSSAIDREKGRPSSMLTRASSVITSAIRQALPRLVEITSTARVAIRDGARKSRRDLRRALESLDDVSMSLSDAIAGRPEASLQSVIEAVALHAQRMASADFAAVGVGGSHTRPFDAWAFAGLGKEQADAIGRLPRSVGVLGFVAQGNETIRLRDVRRHPAYRSLPPNHPAMASFLGVPIRYGGRAEGSLYVANRAGGAEFTHEDQWLMERLAVRAAIAMETARLYASETMKRVWLQSVVDQMPEGVVLMDSGGHVTMENRRMLSLATPTLRNRDSFGNLVAVALRYSTGDIVPPDEFPIVRAILHDETTLGAEFVTSSVDGSTVPVLVSAGPVHNRDGSLAGATMVLEDISALKELERLRDEWASIVAHDLQQPINAIVLRTDLLLQAGLSGKAREEVLHVRASARRLGRMANDLLDASQLETHRVRLFSGPLDLCELVRTAVEEVPGAASWTVLSVPQDQALVVNADAQRIDQVMTNLLTNAVKYRAPGTQIQVDVRLRGTDAEVMVSNEGPGIPADALPFVFERYTRSRAAGTTRGFGLGLYIAKGFVEAHGGRMWVESVPHGLTAFHFTLPLATATEIATNAAPAASDSVSYLQGEPR